MRTEGQQPSLFSLSQLYAPIADDLSRAQQILADELISDQTFISDLCGHIRQFHGKMLRPALLLLAARASGELTPAHHTLGAVVELVHLATLVHDDVLDEADIRRRAATVNRLWGNHRAVLMGDFLYSHAFHLCSSLDSQYAARLIGQTAVTVCEGEMMQVANRGNLDLTEAEYIDIITRKTAVLVEASCRLGARYAGADEATQRRLCTFGSSLGIAFQIVDDLLDLTGDESEVGKSLGRDLSEGELTLPLIRYLQCADAAQREQFKALLASALLPDACLTQTDRGAAEQTSAPAHAARQIAALLQQSDALHYSRAVAAEYVEQARGALAALPPNPARDSLAAMAEFVLARRM